MKTRTASKINSMSRNRNKRGSVAVELAAGSLVMISVVALALNICFAMLSYGINDRACRDAARAAAQGSSAVEAVQMATAIVKSYNSSNSLLAAVNVESVSYNDFQGNAPQGVSPFVTVITRSSAKMPAPVSVFGQNLFGATIPVTKSYTFPIVRLNPTL